MFSSSFPAKFSAKSKTSAAAGAIQQVRHPKSGLICSFDPNWGGQFTFNNNRQKRLLTMPKVLNKYFPFDGDKVAEKLSKSQMRPVSEIKDDWKKAMALGKNVGAHFKAAFYAKKNNNSNEASDEQETGEGDAKIDKKENNDHDVEMLLGKKQEIVELHGDEEQYYRSASKAVDLLSQKYEIIADDVIICSPPGIYSFSSNVTDGKNNNNHDENEISMSPSLGLNLGARIDFLCKNKQNGKICILRVSTTTSTLSSFRFGSFDERVPLAPLDHLPNTRLSKFSLEVLLQGLILREEGYGRFFGHEIDRPGGIEYGVVQFGKSDQYIDISFDLTKVSEDSLIMTGGEANSSSVLSQVNSKDFLVDVVKAAAFAQ